MVDADADLSLVVGDVVNAVGRNAAELWVDEIVNPARASPPAVMQTGNGPYAWGGRLTASKRIRGLRLDLASCQATVLQTTVWTDPLRIGEARAAVDSNPSFHVNTQRIRRQVTAGIDSSDRFHHAASLKCRDPSGRHC